MARKPRPHVPDGLYHVVARGNRRQPIFTEDADHHMFFALLDDVVDRFAWNCDAHCLMRNHYHLVIRTQEPNIARGMARLNAVYAQWFNRQHGYCGHLFEGRYWSALVETDTHRLELMRYVVLNPVRAGLCEKPEHWRWSSYRAAAGLTTAPRFLSTQWVAQQFSGGSDPQASYRRFVLEALNGPAWTPPESAEPPSAVSG